MRPQRCPQQGSRLSTSEALLLLATVVDLFPPNIPPFKASYHFASLSHPLSSVTQILWEQGVVGSNPTAPTTSFNHLREPDSGRVPVCDADCDVTPPDSVLTNCQARGSVAVESSFGVPISPDESLSRASRLACILTWL